MEMRELGRTGLRVTPIGLGLAALGRPAYITTGRDKDLGEGSDRSIEAMEARSHEVLDAAWAAGIRYLDAARSYGYAERFLASWLRARAIDPAEVTVGSKWGYRYVGRVADGRAGPRGEGPLALDAACAAAGVAALARAVASAVPGPLGDARERDPRRCGRARGAGAAAGRGRARHRAQRQRAAAGRRRARRARGASRRRQPVRVRPGDVERARAVGRGVARRGARGGLGRDRQGGARERARARGRRGARRRSRPPPSATGRRATRSRSPRCSPSRGPASCCPGPRRPSSCARTRPRWTSRSSRTRSRRCSRSRSRRTRTGRPDPPGHGPDPASNGRCAMRSRGVPCARCLGEHVRACPP